MKYCNGKIIFLGDFNKGTQGTPMATFYESYNLAKSIKRPTCFRDAKKPNYIEQLILAN